MQHHQMTMQPQPPPPPPPPLQQQQQQQQQRYAPQGPPPMRSFSPSGYPQERFRQPNFHKNSMEKDGGVINHPKLAVLQIEKGPRAPYPGPQMGSGGPPPPPMGMRAGGPGVPPHGYPANSKTRESGTSSMPRTGISPGMPPPGMQGPLDRKRAANEARAPQQISKPKKKKKIADKILPQKVRDLVPESQAYMDLLAFERKLDATIMRKRLDIQEALKRPMKQKRKLRIFISNTFTPGKPEGEDGEESVSSWELRVEGRLLDDAASSKLSDANKVKRKFSSFFKSLVIELDKDLYGPDNHLVEWHRTPNTQETDGFQVKRPGDNNVKCTVLLMLDYQPMQFKLDQRLARLLGMHTQTRPVIINALWQYIKTHKLQDPHEREYINCDRYLEQIFECKRMKFAEIPSKLHPLLMAPDPIVINHIIVGPSVYNRDRKSVDRMDGPDAKKTACYDIDVEVDDTLKQQMNSFLLSTQSQQEIATLDNKIHETVETINQLKINREFFLSFAKDPLEFINNWLISQTRDLKTMTDIVGNPEEERRADYYYQPWVQEAVCRYFYGKVQQRRLELEQALGIRNA
ncbi:SWI/SNF-related matrix-associated actin-dependent regulator of chromatin subfamily D member 1 isoform X41 [Octopus bimaculoides]|uniref:SWI/SNF-related matrix-associated actin-dependent regulator of chromatin subfamily D member 1 isoform X41 n=1 Tax=Octopus bimaculoides TaxID=37653 RepID=UPI00071D6721|nr:SWI/SNF-related matrix-associated actin-dependent regulator of chromatin subfamily D member 1 isoform X41 [Octopus bimaculoides]|eukprot:XP_014770232.1 PREDICTED: SWI/SNF-related matrix-associated actin-dependent regulator of chromatin subfamily D member 1-like isoform X25 [Octopus bimaculoides]